MHMHSKERSCRSFAEFIIHVWYLLFMLVTFARSVFTLVIFARQVFTVEIICKVSYIISNICKVSFHVSNICKVSFHVSNICKINIHVSNIYRVSLSRYINLHSKMLNLLSYQTLSTIVFSDLTAKQIILQCV